MVVETESELNKLKIASNSQELLLETVLTPPVPIEYGYVSFLANGIAEHSNSEKYEEYIKECLGKWVIPFSGINLEYNNRTKFFESKSSFYDKTFRIPEGQDKYELDIMNSLLKGSKVHKIKVDMGKYGSGKAGFEKFKNELLPLFRENEYQLNHGDLWLTTYRLTGYNEGTYASTQLLFDQSKERVRSVELRINDIPSQEYKFSLISWFKQLKEKYGTK